MSSVDAGMQHLEPSSGPNDFPSHVLDMLLGAASHGTSPERASLPRVTPILVVTYIQGLRDVPSLGNHEGHSQLQDSLPTGGLGFPQEPHSSQFIPQPNSSHRSGVPNPRAWETYWSVAC